MAVTTTFRHDPARRTLTLDHPLLSAEWSWTETGAIGCTRLHHIPSDTGWLDPHATSPLYQLDWKEHTTEKRKSPPSPKILTGIHAHTVRPPAIGRQPDGTAEATLELTPADAPLRLTWHVQSHPNHAAIRQWFDVTNTGADPLVITRLPITTFAVAQPAGPLSAHCGLERRHYRRRDEWPDWFTWRRVELRPGVADAVRSGYRKEATWLGLTSGSDGLYLGWEANTFATCDFGDVHGDGGVWVETYLQPDYVLQPGQTLTAPAGFIGFAQGDLDELSYRCHRYVEATIAPPVADERFPYVAFNSWGYGAEIDAVSMRNCFEICRKLGIELFVVDFGWEDPDWQPLANRFPDGLAPLADAAHEAGMVFGIHLSFGNVSSLSTMFRDHPDWANGPGMWAYRREGEVFGLTLGNPETREWIVEKLVKIVDENKIDYFLTDHYLWGPLDPDVTPLHATNDYVTITEGFDLVLERFRELRPSVILEHCDNGLGLPTFKMIRQHHTSIGPDAVGTLYERVHTWRFSRVLPPRYLDHYAVEHVVPGQRVLHGLGDYEYRSHIFGGPMILMTDIMKATEDSPEWGALSRAIDVYKRIRRRVIEGKVLHLLEPQPLERVGRGWDGWDAIGSYHEQTDTAVILAFRLGGDLDTRSIPVHGLRTETRYRVTFEDRPDVLERTGAELMTEGISLTLPHPGQPRVVDKNGMVRGSEIVHLAPV